MSIPGGPMQRTSLAWWQKKNRIIVLLAVFAAVVQFGRVGTANSMTGHQTLSSRDGKAQVTFAADGRVMSLTRAGVSIPLGKGNCGLFVVNPVSGAAYHIGLAASKSKPKGTVPRQVPARFKRTANGLQENAIIAAERLSIQANYHFLADGALRVDGVLTDLRRRDRIADVGFSLPVEAIGGTWQQSIVDAIPIRAGMKEASQTDFSSAAISGPGERYGIAYDIPPNRPQRFEITYSPATGFTILLKFGLSPAGRGPLHSRAPFAFTIDVVNGRWGLRSALDRYYSRNPEWFVNRVHRYGFWMRGVPADYSTFNPKVYAFHEAGGDRGNAQTVAQYAANDGWEYDRKHDILTFPYIIPGQLEITNLKVLPGSYAQAMTDLENWVHPPVFFSAQDFPNSYRNYQNHKQRIENSVLFGPSERHVIKIRNKPWGKNMVTFVTNPNPSLYADRSKKTVAKYLLDYYVPLMLNSPLVDGIDVDSLGGWGAYYNYRRSHFAYEQVPLTYSDRLLKPAIYNDISEIEFLWALRKMLHNRGKLLMANDTKFSVSGANAKKPLPFSSYPLDVVSSEGGGGMYKPENAALYRVMADQKPLVFDITGSEWRKLTPRRCKSLEKVSVLEDFFLSSGPTNHNAEFDRVPTREISYQNKYARVLMLLGKAGWDPITGIKTGDASVLAERYGSQSDFYLVLYNTSQETKHLTLTADPAIVHWPNNNAAAREVVFGSAQNSSTTKALTNNGHLTLAPGEELVLHIGRS